MGTTLQNGVYLPNEGERNCYAGLKTNWEILDQKVADVTALQQAVAGALHREIVESLPTTDIDPNTIYMILSGTSATENVYNEFMYVNNAWELIGTSATDLTNYYTKAEVDGKLLLKANASDLTSHTGDTTIHVTTADKTKWNNGVSQSYVLRYSSSSVTNNSTIAFSTLDNTDNIKSGDKVIDSDGKIFSIVSVDTANQTVTVGLALIDLALDANVVHTSGDETIAGVKTFSDNPVIGSNNVNITVSNRQITAKGFYSAPTGSSYSFMQLKAIMNYANSSPSIDATVGLSVQENAYSDGKNRAFNPNSNNIIDLGLPGKRWANVYATNYYYGSDNVEFSTKFVTTDTAQTISGVKSFSDNISIKKIISNVAQLQINARSSADSIAVIAGADASDGGGFWCYGKNSANGSMCRMQIYNASKSRYESIDLVGSQFLPSPSGEIDCGSTSKKWKSFNGLEPSSLSLPSGNVNDFIDISSYMTILDGSSANTYQAPGNGYISITMNNCSGVQAYIIGFWGHQVIRPSAGGVRFLMPILKNLTANIAISGGTIAYARFIPCQGNV